MSKIEPLPSSLSLVITDNEPEPATEINGMEFPRPDDWPAVMKWPPKRLKDAIKRGQVTSENADKFRAYYEKYAALTQRQADRFAKHLREHGDRNEDSTRFLYWRLKDRIRCDETRNHRHIAWAFMLDPNGDFRAGYDQSITSIGRTTLTTLDGGRMRASEDSVRVVRNSKMTAQLVVDEALARGWDSIKVRGGKQFVMEVMQHAKARGLEVEAVYTMPLVPILGLRRFSNREVLGVDKQAHEELAELGRTLQEKSNAPRKPDMMVGDDLEDPQGGPAGPGA